jgi:NADH-quinone oxidoreductase subunit J
MTFVCYASCGLALVAALMVITTRSAMHALMYLIFMLLALAMAFYALGAPFVAAIQVIVYVGAIMVLFVFVVMMLTPKPPEARLGRRWWGADVWGIPLVLTGALLALSVYALAQAWGPRLAAEAVPPKEVGISLYRDYLLAVEIISLLLLAGLVGAFHLAPRPLREQELAEEGGDG